MGSILAETMESEHIEHLVSPIKDLFGAIFFVSVGMMIAPEIILHNWFVILILAVLVILTHIVFSAIGILLTGNGLENSVHTGFSLAQLGEFGFIIASVGVSLGVMRDFIYPDIVAVSVITTFTTPYMIRLAGPAYSFLLKKMPDGMLNRLNQMERTSKSSAAERSDWHKLLSAYFLRILLYSVILVALMIASRTLLEPFVGRLLPNLSKFVQNLITVGITLTAMAPLLYGLAVNKGSADVYAKRLMKAKPSNSWPIMGLLLGRFFLAIAFVLVVISTHFDLAGWTALLLIIGGVVFFLVSRRRVRERSASLESTFFDNLNAKEVQARKNAPVTASIKAKMAGYDVHLDKLEVSADSSYIGLMLKEIPIRDESGANIVKITRGSHVILIPDGEQKVYPGDELLTVGTEEQLAALREMFKASIDAQPEDQSDFDVETVEVKDDSYLNGVSLKSLDIRKSNCMVISVLRGDNMIINPRAEFVFAPGDVVWIAGDTASVEYLKG